MRLKSLEIKGFKSFANATTLFFDENVTGVVGPNGSGKSNVVDAFRWVLGEQKSKELRLEQMGDVLFNGAENKQQANAAEVSVSFDNTKNLLPTDFNTVKITRRLYRSGESEYRINDVLCRLKDIQTLFLDTGIGSNSYSIIELGMVDDILQDKDNARRRMFEQAAGISKFKNRKKETIQKLTLTNSDLERVEDLLFEIENNLKELEKQARRTKKFYEIKAYYKEISISLAKLRWNALEETQVIIANQIESEKLLYNEQSAVINKKEAALEAEKKKNLIEERNLSEYQKELNLLLDELRSLENEKNLLKQKINYSHNNITKAHEDISKTEPLITQTQDRIQKAKDGLIDFEKKYQEKKASLDIYQDKLKTINAKFLDYKGVQQEKIKILQTYQNQLFETEKQIAVSNNKVEALQKELDQNHKLSADITQGMEGQRKEVDNLEEAILIIDQEITFLNQKEMKRLSGIKISEEKIFTLKEKISKHNRTIDALSNELNLLESMVANLEGFPESVKFLHDKWQGQKVMLSDIINTTDEFRAAVEQHLQPFLNFFIVENTASAKEAISLLQTAQKGKAQFFILDKIENVASEINTGYTTLADVIEVEDQYKPLIRLLCRNVFLVNEIDVFQEELLSAYPEVILLDKSGAIIRGKHHISGGSIGLFEGKKIGRKKRISQLQSQIKDQKGSVKNLGEKLEDAQKALIESRNSRFDIDIKQKENTKTAFEKKVIVIKSKMDGANDQIAKYASRNAFIKEELFALSGFIYDTQVRKRGIENDALKIRSEVADFDKDLDKLSNELSEAREDFNKHNIQLIQLENHIVSQRKEIEFQEHRLKDFNQNLHNAHHILHEQERELTDSENKLTLLNNSLEDKYQYKKERQEKLTSAEQEYFKARATVNQIEDEIRTINKMVNEKQYLINQLKDKYSDIKFNKTSIKERLQIEFNFNIGNIIDHVFSNETSAGELELEIEKYKRRLESYGEINPLALEAYEEMDKRYKHITEQRDDILEAKISLLKTIEEIEETATKLFLDSFDQVRKHFVVVFRSLFTQDDDCDLLLETPEDPLNSKIEIIAKPKGKRPKSLSQLSGGEKTLTATALLFSLYLLKPAPFCIFDEVDAPLDDTNIQKFANIIRAFSDKSQFIIVTHNKSTMAEVDVLYGVYMQKKGVSSVSPVDFRTYEVKGTMQNTSLSTY